MIARVLPREEWGRVSCEMLPLVPPEDVSLVVVEDDSKIVARLMVMRVTHLESLWCDAEYRGNPAVARKLIAETVRAARKHTDKWVFANAESAHVKDLVTRAGGVPLPVEMFVLSLGGT